MDDPGTAPVIVGVDGSTESKEALRWAADYAQMGGAPLVALIAWDIPTSYGIPATYEDVDLEGEAGKTLAEAVTDALDDFSSVTIRTEQGQPAAVFVAASRNARLLVLGSHGRGGFAAALLGSVSQQCIHHAHCPVVVVRGRAADT